MKALCILSLAVLGLVPTILGTAAMARGATTASEQFASVEQEPLMVLKAQAAATDTTLLRPL